MYAKGRCCNRVLKIIMILAVGAVTAMLLMFIVNGDSFEYFSQRKITQKIFFQGIKPDSINLEFYHLNSSVDLETECVKSKTVPPVTLCIYPVGSDIYVSNIIKRYGRWEPLITTLLLEVLRADPTSVFLDVGSNIGYYSLLAAKTGHLVVSVEPNIRSIYRLHQSLDLEGLKGKVIVLKNAVAERRDEIVLSKSSDDQGNNRIKLELKACQGNCPPPLKSIVLNDLTYLIHDLTIISNWEKEIPGTLLYEKLSNFRNERDAFMAQRSETLGLYRKPHSNVILKIDTQGFEYLILNNPDFFFDQNKVTHIFMGWNMITERRRFINKTLIEPKEPEAADVVKVEIMIRFLSERRFKPYSTTLPRFYEALNLSMWHQWPKDILWCHDSQ